MRWVRSVDVRSRGGAVIVIVVVSDCRLVCEDNAGREAVEQSRRLLARGSGPFKLRMSTPESILLAVIGVAAAFSIGCSFGGRTTIERRFQRWVSFSEMFLSTIGSLLLVLKERDLVMAGFTITGLMGAGRSGTAGMVSSFFLGKMCRMIALMLAIDFLRLVSVRVGMSVSIMDGGGEGFSS